MGETPWRFKSSLRHQFLIVVNGLTILALEYFFMSLRYRDTKSPHVRFNDLMCI